MSQGSRPNGGGKRSGSGGRASASRVRIRWAAKEGIAETLVKVVQNRIPERFHLDPIREVQILCPMNRGSLGRAGTEHGFTAGIEPPSGLANPP